MVLPDGPPHGRHPGVPLRGGRAAEGAAPHGRDDGEVKPAVAGVVGAVLGHAHLQGGEGDLIDKEEQDVENIELCLYRQV